MIHRLLIYTSQTLDPYFNIATEKQLLETVETGSCILYLWQNENTVVIGRNQNPWVECRTSLLEEEGGKLARRLSGGGAVFHDIGNLNFTFLMRDEDYDVDRQLSVIQAACAMIGLQAEKSGRNDLLVDGQKFSGNAFFHSQGHAYHHGTLLIDADMEKLSRYLTPSKAKLEAKGVASVRSRVTNLKALVPELTCKKMAESMKKAFAEVYGLTPEQITLGEADMQTIEAYAAELSSWNWLYGPRLPFSFSCEELVDLLYECISIGAVNEASILDRLASGVRAAEAVHTDLEEELCGLHIVVENITDKCSFRYCHCIVTSLFIFNRIIISHFRQKINTIFKVTIYIF